MTIHLSITNQTRAAINTRWLARHLKKLLALQNISRGSWSITIISDRAMKSLHQQTMNDPTTTDVLTFDLRETEPVASARATPIENRKWGGAKIENRLDLDTILCHSEAARRAKEFHHPVNHELLLYALHSLLHVQGYNDLTPRQSARMHRREDALLLRLGLNPIYAPKPT